MGHIQGLKLISFNTFKVFYYQRKKPNRQVRGFEGQSRPTGRMLCIFCPLPCKRVLNHFCRAWEGYSRCLRCSSCRRPWWSCRCSRTNFFSVLDFFCFRLVCFDCSTRNLMTSENCAQKAAVGFLHQILKTHWNLWVNFSNPKTKHKCGGSQSFVQSVLQTIHDPHTQL